MGLVFLVMIYGCRPCLPCLDFVAPVSPDHKIHLQLQLPLKKKILKKETSWSCCSKNICSDKISHTSSSSACSQTENPFGFVVGCPPIPPSLHWIGVVLCHPRCLEEAERTLNFGAIPKNVAFCTFYKFQDWKLRGGKPVLSPT